MQSINKRPFANVLIASLLGFLIGFSLLIAQFFKPKTDGYPILAAAGFVIIFLSLILASVCALCFVSEILFRVCFAVN